TRRRSRAWLRSSGPARRAGRERRGRRSFVNIASRKGPHPSLFPVPLQQETLASIIGGLPLFRQEKRGRIKAATGRTMFDAITRGLSEAFKKLRGRGRITEANVRDGLQEVRKALLEADVNFTVANDFIKRVTEKSLGQQVMRTLDPSEQIVRIVYDELV